MYKIIMYLSHHSSQHTFFTNIPVIKPLKYAENVHFVGTIQHGLDGKFTKESYRINDCVFE